MTFEEYPDVDYTQYFKVDGKLKPTKYSGSCFSSLSDEAEKVVFHCKIDESLTPEEIEFFIQFVSNILDTAKFSIKYKDIYKIKFKLETISLGHRLSLFYLTFFRYLQEFPDIVKELFKHNGESLDELFVSFQHIHYLNKMDKFPIRWENIDGHGLMYNYGERKFKPIDMNTLKDRLQRQEINAVHKYWEKD